MSPSEVAMPIQAPGAYHRPGAVTGLLMLRSRPSERAARGKEHMDLKMRLRGFASIVVAGGLLLCGAVSTAGAADAPKPKEPTKEEAEFFEKKIRPVLAESCYKCHSAEAKTNKKLKGKFYADTWEGLAKGGDSGEPGIVPGDPDKSMVIKAMRYQHTGDEESLNMPPKAKDGTGGKLKDEVIKDFEKWVKSGAAYPKAKEGAKKEGEKKAAADGKDHWSFQPPKEPTVPEVKATASAGWAKNEIDKFVAAKLEAKGLTPSPLAPRGLLIRRATFGLHGLPPTPHEVEAFEKDASPDAWEKVVDRLLASPRYGERWGRHWLDVARYSDTKGYVFQEERRYPYAYTYRDYVIRAFNDDLPYDQFLIHQIAADKLELGNDKRPLAAMGFLTLGRRFLNNLPDIVDDRIDVVTRGTMGLTVSCARCHDHKYDPITAKDYYALYGVFASSTEPKDLPQIEETQSTPASLAFEKELKARQAAAEAFLQEKLKETLAKARTEQAVTEYLLLAMTEGRPEESKLPKGFEANRTLQRRWKEFLDRRDHEAVFGAWREYAKIPADGFGAKATAVTDQLFGSAESAKASNPLVVEAFAGKPPASLREAAERYAALITKFDKSEPLGKAEEEAFRQVLNGPNSPLAVPPGDASRLLRRDQRDQYQALRRKVDEFSATNPNAPARAMVLQDIPNPGDYPVLVRGNPNNPGTIVPRRFLSVIAGENAERWTNGSGRLELAKSIASKTNPLTARVMVNRVWLRHFDEGIVRTPSDFGTRSDPPTHPELLDWLAVRFMEDGWSVKKLHKRILMSATYQQASDDRPECKSADPENLLVWKQNRQRLDFEAMRDSLLYATGRLDTTIGGRPVDIVDAGATRRTVYGSIDRQNLPAMFRSFDFASPDAHSPQRFQTTVPQQALFFMNSPFVHNQAKQLVKREEVASKQEPAERIGTLYRLLYGREATAEEVALGTEFVAAEEKAGTGKLSPWEKYALVLLESNEFVFVD